ncbi:multidrug and toxin extrusion protein 2 [Ascobolus immersus RN42]|uniref:Multidrug and toxin extrusion protein 2 n=1 Tax=Ascobolus immersus RN42 TaxID=1160509 RepID=A0A3N4IGZ7_ASCIM|nr:multidrug and toxin extrusion protein 2 [Ascobolus immersus RN42]
MISRLDSRSNNVSEYCATQTETDQLLGNTSKWSESHSVQELETTWQAEAKLLTKNAAPLVVTLALQYSLTIASVFSAGNLGSNELAACSLASMTANITGIAIYNGLAAALDTLCSQAYGAGNKILVGVYLQRMAAFLMVLTIPISMVWWNGEQILRMMIPEPELARLAGLYLRVLAFGMPGHALFECGRRYTQAQGLFRAPMIVLLITAPLNMLLNYLLVWNSHIGLGFVGAPLAVVISNYCMPFFLFLYIRFYSGSDCWGGFTRRAFQNWWPMIKLALPGLVMVEAEFLAFEALVLMASHISGAHVAANAIVAQCGSVLWRFSFALSIATSTRVGIFVGAMAPEAAKTTANTSLVLSCILGCINASILFSTRYQIPRLFSKDEHVIAIAAAAMPLVGFFQIADCIQCVAAGVLRGQGRQYIGSYVNLVAYYIVALPWSYYTCFFLAWELMGLWSGMAIALALIAVVECFVVLVTNWKRVVGECRARESWA